MDLVHSRVLVTGASSGLGEGFARALASQGAQVVVAARRVERLQRVVEAIRASGGRAAAVALDVTRVDSIARCLQEASQVFGGLDVLVNNSGTTATHRLEDVTEEEFDHVFDTNVRGAFFVAQAFARQVLDARLPWASIVNVASASGLRPIPRIGPYAVSKAALIHMTKAMALEWGRKGLVCNAICPGYVRTDINDELWDSDEGRKLLQRLPRRRLGTIDDLTDAVSLLCSPRAQFMNGAVIAIDDGLSV